MILTNLLYLIILGLGIPAGLILSKLCPDEIKKWRGRLKIMIFFCVILILLVFVLSSFAYKVPTILSLLFIIIINLTIILRTPTY